MKLIAENYEGQLATPLKPFASEGYGVAAAEAESGDATFQVAALQFVQESDENSRSARSDRMANRNGAAIDVHFFGIEFQLSRHGEGGDRKRFVQFDEVNIFVAVPAGFCQKVFDGIDRRHHYPFRFDAANGLAADSRDLSLPHGPSL